MTNTLIELGITTNCYFLSDHQKNGGKWTCRKT